MTSHNVMVAGTIAAHTNRESAIAALTERFKLDAHKAAALLGGKPTVVKRGVDEQSAERFCSALQAIGVDAYIQRIEAAAAAPPQSATAPPPPAARPPAPSRGWRFELDGQPDYAFLTVHVPAGETIKVEASAMATMDTHLVMKTKLRGGLSRFLTGESIFINEFTADGGPGEIGVAPGAPGDMRHLYLEDQTVYLQNSAYVASNAAVAVESKWQGLTKGFFSGESLFLIRASGRGDLWFSSYGGIIEIDVDGDYVVDTGNIVAFTEGLTYKVSKVGGYKSLFFSGEGFVCRFSGKGTVWAQTRKVGALASWVWPFRPTK